MPWLISEVIVPDLSDVTLTVVMPAYNERATIVEIVQRVMEAPVRKELIVVDDGSADGTREILESLRGCYPPEELRVIFHPRNQGKGAALRTGVRAARGDYVIIQDADLEYDPREYGRLLQPCLEYDADVVYGSRFAGSGPHRVLFFWHAVANRILTTVSNAFTDLNLTDMETCFKLFRADVIRDMTLEQDRFGFEPEVTAKIAHRNLKIYEVGISYYGRGYAEGKKIGWRDAVEALYCIVRYGLQRHREASCSKRGLIVDELKTRMSGPANGSLGRMGARGAHAERASMSQAKSLANTSSAHR